jgi:DNA-directed RNA polymerase specialized sigma24 family protein
MPLTFEERISEDLDALYSGAAFLSGSQGGGAQRLLVDAVSRASSEYRLDGDAGAFTPWMEGILVRTLLASEALAGGKEVKKRRRPSADRTVGPHELDDIGWADMVRAAARIPIRPRAALWLVLLRRWRYSEAAATIGVDLGALRELLGHRDGFFQEVIRGAVDVTAQDTGS